MTTTETTERRTWTEVGAMFTEDPDDRARIERVIDGLTWKAMPRGGTLSLPVLPGEGIKAVIAQLALPRVSAVAHDGYLAWPDRLDGTAHYSVYGIEANYKDGRARVYLLDTGSGLTPLASDFWKEAHWTAALDRDGKIALADELKARRERSDA